jgi:hypothetical protein
MGEQQISTEELGHKLFGAAETIPWENTSALGGGYDSRTYQPCASPFVDYMDIEPRHKTPMCAVFRSHIVHAEHSLEEGIELSCGISAWIPSGPISASADLSRVIKYDSTTITTIISCNVVSPTQKSHGAPRLKPAAKTHLRWRPKKFAELYGTHFISGYQCQASLVVVLCHSTTTKQNMDTFKAKLGINYKIASLGAASEYASVVKDCGIETDIHVFILGADPIKILQHANLNDADPTPLFKTFLESQAPVPFLALLTPYSWIDSRAISPSKPFSLPQGIIKATMRSRLLHARAQSCSMKKAHSMLPTLSRLGDKASGIRLSVPNWRDRLAAWDTAFKRNKEEVDQWYWRQDLLERVAQLVSTTEWKKSVFPSCVLVFELTIPSSEMRGIRLDKPQNGKVASRSILSLPLASRKPTDIEKSLQGKGTRNLSFLARRMARNQLEITLQTSHQQRPWNLRFDMISCIIPKILPTIERSSTTPRVVLLSVQKYAAMETRLGVNGD